jgi:3-dehydroquinate dehydratase-1
MDFDSFVLAAATTDLDDEPAARAHADALEFRMDGADDPLADLAAYDGTLPLIATNRPEGEGGAVPDDERRLDQLLAAAERDAVAAVDIELGTVDSGEAQGVLLAAHEHDAAVIVSTHDFGGTPERAAIEDLLARAGEYADVAKVAVTAESPDDVLALLAATRTATAAGDRVATMAMGEAGRHSRAVAPLYGSKIGYAPVDAADATAPGQYDLATLRDLVEQLGGPPT